MKRYTEAHWEINFQTGNIIYSAEYFSMHEVFDVSPPGGLLETVSINSTAQVEQTMLLAAAYLTPFMVHFRNRKGRLICRRGHWDVTTSGWPKRLLGKDCLIEAHLANCSNAARSDANPSPLASDAAQKADTHVQVDLKEIMRIAGEIVDMLTDKAAPSSPPPDSSHDRWR